MSAQRLSALFPLRKFFSVVNLNLNRELLFDKKRNYESVWDWVFYFDFFEAFSKSFITFCKKKKFSKTLLPIFKNGVSIGIAPA